MAVVSNAEPFGIHPTLPIAVDALLAGTNYAGNVIGHVASLHSVKLEFDR